MRTKLLIASADVGYAEHLSNYISEHYRSTIEVSMFRTQKSLADLPENQRFDAALFDVDLLEGFDTSRIVLPVLLVSEDAEESTGFENFETISKYQRISAIVSELLSKCAKITKYSGDPDSNNANITAVWSPSGGVGKTTVALSYAASRAAVGKRVLYLNLEPFSSVPAYFNDSGKSISAAFEMLENAQGNLQMLIRGICQQDREAGVAYFCRPENFDDMYALSSDNIAELTTVCAGVTEELVVDMSCVCDWRTRKVFELVDTIFIVTDKTTTAQVKLSQFLSQHNVFESIKEKVTLVANKGAAVSMEVDGAIWKLPWVSSSDPKTVYKTLSSCFE
ncbi:MAG: hypothetical protein FWC66_01175 [Oscillospiraceae bacterium]|nr:hypothetical protein [Oscillospiraceae bacterium]